MDHWNYYITTLYILRFNTKISTIFNHATSILHSISHWCFSGHGFPAYEQGCILIHLNSSIAQTNSFMLNSNPQSVFILIISAQLASYTMAIGINRNIFSPLRYVVILLLMHSLHHISVTIRQHLYQFLVIPPHLLSKTFKSHILNIITGFETLLSYSH